MTEVQYLREIENLEAQNRKLKESLTACKLDVNKYAVIMDEAADEIDRLRAALARIDALMDAVAGTPEADVTKEAVDKIRRRAVKVLNKGNWKRISAFPRRFWLLTQLRQGTSHRHHRSIGAGSRSTKWRRRWRRGCVLWLVKLLGRNFGRKWPML